MRTNNDKSYAIDDLQHTTCPEEKHQEGKFHYDLNFCGDVTSASLNRACQVAKVDGSGGGVLQSFYLSDAISFCKIIGRYDPTYDDTFFTLLDTTDPSAGVQLNYVHGDICGNITETFKERESKIDIICRNTEGRFLSAQEPVTCQYHLQFESYHGCPTVSHNCRQK